MMIFARALRNLMSVVIIQIKIPPLREVEAFVPTVPCARGIFSVKIICESAGKSDCLHRYSALGVASCRLLLCGRAGDHETHLFTSGQLSGKVVRSHFESDLPQYIDGVECD